MRCTAVVGYYAQNISNSPLPPRKLLQPSVRRLVARSCLAERVGNEGDAARDYFCNKNHLRFSTRANPRDLPHYHPLACAPRNGIHIYPQYNTRFSLEYIVVVYATIVLAQRGRCRHKLVLCGHGARGNGREHGGDDLKICARIKSQQQLAISCPPILSDQPTRLMSAVWSS